MNDTLIAVLVGLGVGVVVPVMFCRHEIRHAVAQWQGRRSQHGRL